MTHNMNDTTPSPAAAGSEELIHQLADAFKPIIRERNCKVDEGLTNAMLVAKAVELLTAQNNATYEAVMEAIGPDAILFGHGEDWEGNIDEAMNDYRSDLRQSIAKIFGKEQP